MKRARYLLKYFKYSINSFNEHGIHSPFVFDLYTNIIKDTNPYYAFENIEALRKEMLLSKKEISVKDLGTGLSGEKKVISFAEKRALVKGRKLLEDKDE